MKNILSIWFQLVENLKIKFYLPTITIVLKIFHVNIINFKNYQNYIIHRNLFGKKKNQYFIHWEHLYDPLNCLDNVKLNLKS